MAVHAVDGHKVTWALGSMLYEINTLPWQYELVAEPAPTNFVLFHWIVFLCLTVASVLILSKIFKSIHPVYYDEGIVKKLSDDDTDDIEEEEKYLLSSDSDTSKLYRLDKQVSMPIYGSTKHPQDKIGDKQQSTR
jgi:hypothetical protein